LQITQIQCFVAVAEEQSFTKAADRMYLGQPNVSHHIRRLEAELGVTLFQRGRHGARLTEAGEEFLKHARTAMVALEKGKAEMQEFSGLVRGRVRLGMGVYSVVDQVADMVSGFRQTHPSVEVQIDDALSADEAGERLAEGEYDVVVVSEGITAPDVECTKFAQMVVRLAVPLDHPFAEREAVAVSELAGEDLIFWRTHPAHETLTEVCREQGFEPKMAFSCRTLTTIRSLVSHGLGSAAVSTAVAGMFEPATAVVDLRPPQLVRDYYLCWRPDVEHPPSGRAFIDHARTYAAQHVGQAKSADGRGEPKSLIAAPRPRVPTANPTRRGPHAGT
jgi:DNA-binding transcriptional LysR family regulator